MKTPLHILESNRKWKQENKVKNNAYSLAWKKRNPEKVRENMRLYYLKNKKKLTKQRKKYREENKQKVREQQRKYYQKTKYSAKYRYTKYRYGAEKRGYQFRLSLDEFCQLISSECHYCGADGRVGIDRRDNNTGYLIQNCVPCCSKCNYLKGKKSVDEFLELAEHFASIAKNLSKN